MAANYSTALKSLRAKISEKYFHAPFILSWYMITFLSMTYCKRASLLVKASEVLETENRE